MWLRPKINCAVAVHPVTEFLFCHLFRVQNCRAVPLTKQVDLSRFQDNAVDLHTAYVQALVRYTCWNRKGGGKAEREKRERDRERERLEWGTRKRLDSVADTCVTACLVDFVPIPMQESSERGNTFLLEHSVKSCKRVNFPTVIVAMEWRYLVTGPNDATNNDSEYETRKVKYSDVGLVGAALASPEVSMSLLGSPQVSTWHEDAPMTLSQQEQDKYVCKFRVQVGLRCDSLLATDL